MSLDSREQRRTRAELAENLTLAQTSPDAIAEAIGLPQARVDAALAVTGARPEDVWLVRDYLEYMIKSLGETPVRYTKLSENMRAAAQTWFPLTSVDDAMKTRLMFEERTTFGAGSTALEVVNGIDLRGKNAIVTGAGSGIGVETARALAAAGASVTLAVRNVATGDRVAADIRASTGNPDARAIFVDLANLGSVRAFADGWSGPLHLLVNNAGIMDAPEQRTTQGWEMHFAVNHLGHFALAQALHPAMRSAGGARIVSVSSSGHGSSGIRFDDPFFERDAYDAGVAYGQSKTANVLFALEATQRWQGDGIAGSAVMPGGIWTNLQRHWNSAVLTDAKSRFPTKTVEQGAATTVYVATRAELGPGTPAYYEDCHPAAVVGAIEGGVHGVVPHALDPVAAGKLWEMSVRLLAASRY